MPHFTHPTSKQLSAYRQRFVISDDKFTPLYVLSHRERRAPEALVSALALLQRGEYEALIAGEHDSSDMSLANVRYVGEVKNIEQLYAACDITIALAGSESSDQSVIKSLMCETPVLISKESGLAELLSDNECLLVGDITAENIASALREARRIEFNITANFAGRQGLEKHIAELLSENR